MPNAFIRFYAELNDFLPAPQRQTTSVVPIQINTTVKHLIESLGVPHTEIDLILVNGEAVDFTYRVQDGDRISVYPVFESLNIAPVTRLWKRPLRRPRFVADTHLGRLAAYLRMTGFDTLYRNDYSDNELASLSQSENRILLTRDRGLLKRNQVTHGFFIRHDEPFLQLVSVIERFDLHNDLQPFTRCLSCNNLLDKARKEDILDRLPVNTAQTFVEFKICQSCGKVYWKGSHYNRMSAMINRLQSFRKMPVEKRKG